MDYQSYEAKPVRINFRFGPVSVADIGVFSCAKCGKPMKLSCIEPAEPGFDVRTFECEKCNHTVKFAVSI